MMRNLKKRAINKLRRMLDKIEPAYLGDEFQCPLCKTNLARFEPFPMQYFRELNEHQHVSSIFTVETLNLEHYTCPVCYANDRDRIYALYFESVREKVDNRKLVDFAPGAQLREFLKTNFRLDYRSADLYMQDVDDKVDITNMPEYADESFDIFICSHVLEHVSDDRKALGELRRILKTGGWGIAVVPLTVVGEGVHEDPTITSEADRWKYYGQNDHVRGYTKQGFLQRLHDADFAVEQLGIDYFGAEAFRKHGIQSRSVVYVVHK